MKVKNNKEFVQEEVPTELYEQMKESIVEEDLNSSIKATKCLSFLCNEKDQYFLIHSDLSIPEKVSFIIKIEYKEEGE